MDNWIVGKKHSQDIMRFLIDQSDISDGPIVCFDYFDTLVVRHVAPEHTKRLAARLLSHVMNDLMSGAELYSIRQELEKKICEQNAASGGDLDFNLAMFSHHYYQTLKTHDLDLLIDWELEAFIQLILDLELSVEKSVQVPCVETIRVLQELKDNEVMTVLLSDFYLPGSHFHLMLEAHGLHDLFDHIYISADYGMTKGSGRLYGKVCEDLACRPEQMIMIGDNPHADVKMARESGVRSIQVHNPLQQDHYELFQKQEQAEEGEVEQKFGLLMTGSLPFPEMGYSLWLFIYRLFQKLIEDKIKNVFFFSKEGEYLKRIFDRFQKDLYGHEIIASYYLLVSRKATFLASLRPLDQESFSRLFNHYRDISLRDFLLSLNIEEQVAIKLCKDLNLDYEFRHFDLRNCPEFDVLLNSKQFRRLFEERRCQQRENFVQYLDSLGVDYRGDGMTIVDVGWKGSIQDNVFYILEGKVDMQGYYIGSLIATERQENNRKKGILFEDYPEPTPFFKVFNNNRSLYEMMLGASHGSADGYYTRAQYDALPKDKHRTIHATVSGEPEGICVVVLDLPEERQLYKESIKPIQDEYFDLLMKLNREYMLVDCTVPSAEWFARQHARMVFKPTETEVGFFERLYHLENFGIFEFTDFRSDNQLGLRQRLRNFRELIRDKEQLETGIWPPIILRRLGLNFYRYIDGRQRFLKEFK
jgi:FMN phosphatase YigB (HAD superfamily)